MIVISCQRTWDSTNPKVNSKNRIFKQCPCHWKYCSLNWQYWIHEGVWLVSSGADELLDSDGINEHPNEVSELQNVIFKQIDLMSTFCGTTTFKCLATEHPKSKNRSRRQSSDQIIVHLTWKDKNGYIRKRLKFLKCCFEDFEHTY